MALSRRPTWLIYPGRSRHHSRVLTAAVLVIVGTLVYREISSVWDRRGDTAETNITSAPVVTSSVCLPATGSHWVPYVFLWVAGAFYLPLLIRRSAIPRNHRYLLAYRIKTVMFMVVVLVTLVTTVLGLFHQSIWVNTPRLGFTAAVHLVSVTLTAIVTVYELRRGVHPSVLPATFLLLLLAAEYGPTRTIILQDNRRPVSSDIPTSVCEKCSVAVAIVTCVWSVVVDMVVPTRWFCRNVSRDGDHTATVDPVGDTNMLSRYTFLWMYSQIIRASRRVVSQDDLFRYKPADRCRSLVLSLRAAMTKTRRQQGAKSGLQRRLVISALRLLTPRMLFGVALRSAGIFLLSTNLFTFRSLIRHLENRSDPDQWWGIYLSLRLFTTSVLFALLTNYHFMTSHAGAARLRGLLSALVMQKLVASRQVASSGEVTSHMTVDVQKVANIFSEANLGYEIVIYAPAALIIMWQAFGPASLLGLLILSLVFILNGLGIRRLLVSIKAKEMVEKVKRIKLMHSILSGIQVLKLYAWEEPYERRVTDTRERELRLLRLGLNLQTTSSALFLLAPYATLIGTLVVYVLTSPEHVVSADRIFVVLAAIGFFIIYGLYLPVVIAIFIQGIVSLKRLLAFLTNDYVDVIHGNGDDIHGNGDVIHDYGDVIYKQAKSQPGGEKTNPLIETDDRDHGSVSMKDCSFSWDGEERTLEGLNLSVESGELLAVVGTVGCGKTALLHAILGELRHLSGSMDTKGSVAYVPQEAWIMYGTLRENITFGTRYDFARYQMVVDACALTADIDQFKDGDLTEVGERGVTLSGGQKQRTSLARAVYADADLYLLDDPFSAVDAKVGTHLFHEVVGPHGLLNGKTRVLVTNSVQWLAFVDRVLVLEAGHVTEMGTYEELMQRNGHLVAYLSHVASSKVGDGSREPAGDRTKSVRPEGERTKMMTDELVEHNKSSLRTLLTYMKAGGLACYTVVLAGLVILTALNVATNLWISKWSALSRNNQTLAKQQSYYNLGIFVTLGCSEGGATLSVMLLICHASIKAARRLHRRILHRVMRATRAFFDTTPGGRILNWFTKDTDDLDTSLANEMSFFIYSLPSLLGAVCLSAAIVPYSLLITVPAAAIFVIIQRLYSNYVREVARLDAVSRSPVYALFNEVVQGAVTIRAFRRQGAFCDRFCALVDDSTAPFWHLAAAKSGMIVWVSFLSATISLSVSIFCVLQRHKTDATILAATIYYTIQMLQLLQSFVRHSSQMERALVAVERITGHNHIVEEPPWHDKPVDPEWPAEGSIELTKVSARYRPGCDLVLDDVTLNIYKGEKIGVIGRTGAGKTSLTLVLMRMIEPSSGKLTIDGQDIAQVGIHDLRSKVTVITQDSVLFEGSVRSNLDPFGTYADDDLWRALQHVKLKAFVEASPSGLDMYCGEAGEVLSHGQRQLVSFARALLRRSQVLILDEPTAGVDVVTDEFIQRSLRDHFHHCTVITVAHRINNIINYDRVLVMSEGRVVEFDTPRNLMADQSSHFYSFAAEAGLHACVL